MKRGFFIAAALILTASLPLVLLTLLMISAPLPPPWRRAWALEFLLFGLLLGTLIVIWKSRAHLERQFHSIVLLICAVVFSVLGVDLTSRAILGPLRDAIPSQNYPDKSFWYYKPGLRLTKDGVFYRFNSWGFRGPEPTVSGSQTKKVLLLGDSIPFGTGFPESVTFPRRAEALINREPPGDTRVEIMNASITGFSLMQMKDYYLKGLAQLPRDIVLVCFYMDDINREVRYKKNSVLYTPTWPEWVQDAFYTDPIANSVMTRLGYHDERLLIKRSRTYDQAWPEVFNILENLRKDCEMRKVRLAVFNVPRFDWPDRLENSADYPHLKKNRELEKWCLDKGVAYYDTLPAFLRLDVNSVRVSKSDIHFNTAGHAMMADELRNFILRLLGS